jgi:transposase
MSIPDPTAAGPTPVALLPDDVATLQRMVLELLATLRQERCDHAALRHRLDLLLRRLYGPRSERHDPNQPLLFPDPDVVPAAPPPTDPAPPAPPATPTPPRRRCRPHGRRRLPENLSRERRDHELAEAERLCPGCGRLRQDIGVDRSEQLEYRPASLFVLEHVVHKYACPCCSPGAAASAEAAQAENPALPAPAPQPAATPATAVPAASGPSAAPVGPASEPSATPAEPTATPAEARATVEPAATPVPVVLAAAKPAMPIDKGLPGPGLLAHLIVSKYTDHLPLYRLERIYERQGVFLARSTLCDWLAACAVLVRPLYALLVQAVLRARALHTDDTPVKLQDPVSHQLSTARLWVYLGDAAQPYNVFDFTPNRKRDGPQQFLANYQGYLHADAFSGYDGLYLPDPRTSAARIVEVACNAHARRKFYEARGTDLVRAHRALAYYGQLYELERAAKDFSEEQRLQMRRELAVPILGQLREWLEAERGAVLPKSPLGEALGYALNHWEALCRYTEAGFLAIDNNAAEREMKRVAIGRKNWLTIGSMRGGETAAVLMSLTSTCARLGVEPWSYLEEVLRRLPGLAAEQVEELLPDRWQAARQGQGVGPATPSPEASPPAPKSPS